MTGFTFKNVVNKIQSTNLNFAAFDFYTDGADDQIAVTAIGCLAAGAGWNIAPPLAKASWTYINCDNPSGSDLDFSGRQAGLIFTQLPGQNGVKKTTPTQGDNYYITDGNQATIGGNVAAGSGSNKSYVTWNGTNWLRQAA